MRRIHRTLLTCGGLLLALTASVFGIDPETKPLDSDLAVKLNDRGEDFRKKGEFDKAIMDYTEAIRLIPKFSWPYNNRGLARAAKGEFDDALKDYNEAIRLDPMYAFAFNNRGLVWAVQGELDKAIKDYDEAIRLSPKYAFPFHNRGVIWVKHGDYGKAIADFADAAQLDPQFAAPNNEIAWIRATCADPRFRAGKEAIVFATKACELSGWKSYNELDTLAAAYAEAGEFTSAVIWGQTALEKAPDAQKESCRERLELYQANKPYHQKPKPEANQP